MFLQKYFYGSEAILNFVSVNQWFSTHIALTKIKETHIFCMPKKIEHKIQIFCYDHSWNKMRYFGAVKEVKTKETESRGKKKSYHEKTERAAKLREREKKKKKEMGTAEQKASKSLSI